MHNVEDAQTIRGGVVLCLGDVIVRTLKLDCVHTPSFGSCCNIYCKKDSFNFMSIFRAILVANRLSRIFFHIYKVPPSQNHHNLLEALRRQVT